MALHKALLHEQLVYRAEHDVLTGLASRDLLLERFATYRQKHECTGNELAFVMVSIDNMKSVSDANGYVFGDQMLVEIGRRFCGLVKNGETLSRFDGGNFVALLQAGNGLSALDRATEFVEEIDSALSTALFVEGRKIHVSATKGGAVYPRDSRNSTGLLRRADAALHEALQSDRGSVRWFDAALERRIEQRYEAEQALRYAIERDELDLYYQPITDPYDGAIVGAESLIRWQRPGFGFVSPDVFIPQAEQTGLIEAIGSWTLLRACTRFEAWRRCGMELPYISVNVSGRQLTKDEFSQQLEAILIESGLPPEKLVLEVTETAMIGRLDACIAQLKAVRRLGVRVAIDDFGTGYASLKYVKYLPADMFKIDQLFVSDLPNNPRDLAIVSAVQELAAQVGTDIIVEGVETADQVRVLTERGIRKLQGYFYSKPLSERDFFAYLAAHQPDTARATVIG
jgi:diguanylate cyclase (GGDEF)-like protein